MIKKMFQKIRKKKLISQDETTLVHHGCGPLACIINLYTNYSQMSRS